MTRRRKHKCPLHARFRKYVGRFTCSLYYYYYYTCSAPFAIRARSSPWNRRNPFRIPIVPRRVQINRFADTTDTTVITRRIHCSGPRKINFVFRLRNLIPSILCEFHYDRSARRGV